MISERRRDSARRAQTTPIPLFRYYKFNDREPRAQPDELLPTDPHAHRDELGSVARISISFRRAAPISGTSKGATVLPERRLRPHRRPQRPDPEADMPDLLTRLDARAERGFSMFLVIMAMFVTSMFVAAAFAAANGDLAACPASRRSASRPTPPPRPGSTTTSTRLQLDPDYWTKCDTGAAPERAPSRTRSTRSDGRRRRPPLAQAPGRRRPVHDRAAAPTPGLQPRATRRSRQSFVDMTTGTFKVRVTGRAGTTDDPHALDHRDLPARRLPELRLLHATTRTATRRPQPTPPSATRQQKNCVEQARTARSGNGCTEIQFASGDGDQRPAAHQRREPPGLRLADLRARQVNQDGTHGDETDTIEVTRRHPRLRVSRAPAAASRRSTRRPTAFTTEREALAMPESNAAARVASPQTSNSLYTGKTIIRLTARRWTITNSKGVTTTNVAVADQRRALRRRTTARATASPDRRRLRRADRLRQRLRQRHLLEVADDRRRQRRDRHADVGARCPTDADITRSTARDATLGLIANNFVRVGAPGQRAAACSNYVDRDRCSPNVTHRGRDPVAAALVHRRQLRLRHALGTLTVNGAIVQKYRGPVGTGSSAATSPPATSRTTGTTTASATARRRTSSARRAAWDVVRSHEFVKALRTERPLASGPPRSRSAAPR